MKEGRQDFRVFRGRDGLRQLEQDWRKLCARLAHPRFFHYPELYSSYIDALLGDEATLYFLAMYEDGALQAVFPLRKTQRRLLGITRSILELPNHLRLRLWDFIVAPEAENPDTLPALLRFLSRSADLPWHVLRLREIMTDSAAATLVRLARPPLRIVEPAGFCGILPLLPYEQTRRRISKNMRNRLNTAKNRLERAGGGRFRHARDVEELQALYREFLRVEASGWKGAAGTAVRDNPALTQFFHNMMTRFGALGRSEITVLEVGGAVVSAQLSTVFGDTCYMHKICYDEAYGKLSPGHLVVDAVLRRYAEDRTIRFMNLISDLEWQTSWRPDRTGILDCYIYRASPQGLLAYFTFCGRLMARSLRRTLAARRSGDAVAKPIPGQQS